MVRITALQTALIGLIGLRPHYNPTVPQWAPDLLNSRSGMYLNDIHPLITPENLIATLPKAYAANFLPFNPQTGATRGAIVLYNGELYIAGKDATAGPETATAGWLRTDVLSAKTRQLCDAAVAQVANAVIQRKKIDGAKSVVSETQLYHGAGNITHRIIKTGRFCGFEIMPKMGRDIGIRIGRIGLQVDTPNPALNIYLYHTSQATPIKIIPANFQGSGMFSWSNVADTYLALNSDAYAPGGRFLLGYYEDDLLGQIIDREVDWTDSVVAGVGCGYCNPLTTQAFQIWSEQLEFHPFSVAAVELNVARTLWNHERIKYSYRTNFGLNLNLVLECDATQFLVRNESLLADAIAKQAVVNILTVYANTVENNALAEMCKQHALYQLDNRENNTAGLRKELERALDTLALDMVDEESPCLPPKSKGYTIRDGVA